MNTDGTQREGRGMPRPYNRWRAVWRQYASGSPTARTSTQVWPRLKVISLPAASKKRVREKVSGLDQVPGTATPSWKTTASPPPMVLYSRWAVPSPAERADVTITATFFAWSWLPEPPPLWGAPP